MNSDGSLTIYAKGTDTAGNSKVVSEKTYVLDLDAPKAPVINAHAGYPILTEYGVQYDDVLSVSYDSRDDITNYISVDGGTTWQVYTGVEHIKSGTIKAKSVKKSSGLTVTSTKTVGQPSDGLPITCYDGNKENNCMGGSGRIYDVKRIEVDSIVSNDYRQYAFIEFYDKDGNKISSYDNQRSTAIKVIPEETKWINIGVSGYVAPEYVYFREVSMYTNPNINVEKKYPKLTEYGVEQGYSNVTIDYYKTAVKRQYSLDNGETWNEYIGKIKMPLGQKVIARSIDKYGTISSQSNYTSVLPDDGLPITCYDGNKENNCMGGSGNWRKS